MGHPRRKTQLPCKPAGFRLKDAATYSGVGEERIRQLIKEGKLVAHRDGRRVIVETASLDEHLATFRRKNGWPKA